MPLHDGAPRALFDRPVLVGHDREPTVGHAQEFSRFEQEIRIRRTAERFVAARERLVEQRAVLGERHEQRREERAMQVVRNDDRVEPLAVERPRAGFEVEAHGLDVRDARERRERPGVTIDGEHPAAAARKESRVAPGPAGEIQQAGARGHERREADEPRRRRQRGSSVRGASVAHRALRRAGLAGARSPTSRRASSASQVTNSTTSERPTACGATTA